MVWEVFIEWNHVHGTIILIHQPSQDLEMLSNLIEFWTVGLKKVKNNMKATDKRSNKHRIFVAEETHEGKTQSAFSFSPSEAEG